MNEFSEYSKFLTDIPAKVILLSERYSKFKTNVQKAFRSRKIKEYARWYYNTSSLNIFDKKLKPAFQLTEEEKILAACYALAYLHDVISNSPKEKRLGIYRTQADLEAEFGEKVAYDEFQILVSSVQADMCPKEPPPNICELDFPFANIARLKEAFAIVEKDGNANISQPKFVRKRILSEEVVRIDDVTDDGEPVTDNGEPVVDERTISLQKIPLPDEDVLPTDKNDRTVQIKGGEQNQEIKVNKEGTLEPKAPEIFQNLLWVLLYGKKHWKLLLLVILILLITSLFVLPKFDMINLISRFIKSIHF